jgi:serine/threonine protein kinase
MEKRVNPLFKSDPKYIGKWEITGRLGDGGFSTIYLGKKDGFFSAIKVIRRELINEPQTYERFGNEIKNLEKLDDPGIAKFIEADLSTEIPYIALEYIDGLTLEELVKTSGPLSEELWLDYFSSMSTTLLYCHARDIIHKDISPRNIIISENGPKLIDFGFSHEKGSERISTVEQVVGTYPYMSPEHFLSINPDAPMDVFSLASTFYFAATGDLPFPGSKNREWEENIRYHSPILSNTLTELQKSLLVPMFYKDPKKRTDFDQISFIIKNFQKNNDIEIIKKFIGSSKNKLTAKPKVENKIKKGVKNLVAVILIAIVATAGSITFFTLQKNSSVVSRELLPDSNLAPDIPELIAPSPDSPSPSSTSVKISPNTKSCKSIFDQKKYQEAIKLCAQESDSGSINAQYYLGSSYRLTSDDSNARSAFQSCAQKGKLECVNEFAYFQFREGDKTLARSNWIKAFEGGVLEAGRALGVSYKTENNFPLALQWFDKASNKGDNVSSVYAVDLLQFDVKDLDKALVYAKKYSSTGVSGMDERVGGIYYQQKKYSDAKNSLLSCAEKGNIPCMSLLALVYYEEKDAKNAKIWAGKAAAKDQVAAINLMARISIYLEYDLATGKSWYQKSASKGDLEGMHSLGSSFALVDSDLKMGCFWWGQVFLKGYAMQDAGTDKDDTQRWIDASKEQYDKRDCKNILG